MLRPSLDVPLDKACSTANASLKELPVPVTISQKEGASGTLAHPAIIQTVRKANHVTEIQIRAGAFDSAANRTEAQHNPGKMKARF